MPLVLEDGYGEVRYEIHIVVDAKGFQRQHDGKFYISCDSPIVQTHEDGNHLYFDTYQTAREHVLSEIDEWYSQLPDTFEGWFDLVDSTYTTVCESCSEHQVRNDDLLFLVLEKYDQWRHLNKSEKEITWQRER